MADWIKTCYARLLIDNHITEEDPSFMTKFDPRKYVNMVKKARVDSAMIYSCCHNGNCYYPTKVGHMHRNLNGRDIFGETVSMLIEEGIVPVAYTTVIYHNDSAKNNPDWRMKDISGKEHNGRYWYSCPNNKEYVKFSKKHLLEVISYNVQGIFIDMTFWPMICRCESCLMKYKKEFERKMPDTIDWRDPEWVSFQRARERWMAEFAKELTSHIKAQKPEITVVHQFSPVLHGWFLGQNSCITDASDYSSGDFYGGTIQQRFGTKVLAAYSQNIPYEYMTSRCVTLRDHTSMKSEEELFCHAASTLANGGAFFFIDAINPDGTLCNDVYERLGSVAKKLRPFKELIQKHRPEICADTGLYFSMNSCVNNDFNGIKLDDLNESDSNMESIRNVPTLKEILGASTILTQANIPYKIITDRTDDFDGFKTIIINNAAYLSEKEMQRLRDFANEGGTLIITGMTSYFTPDGASSGDLALADILGVSYTGKMSECINYLAMDYDKQKLVSCDRKAPLTKATTAKVMAKVAEPIFKCNDPEKYASIHSNPPGKLTEYCALAENACGKGMVVYLYSSIMESQQYAQQEFIKSLFKKYISSDIIIFSNAPSCVEVTMLKSNSEKAYILCVVNFQNELPNIPVHNLEVVFCPPEPKKLGSIKRVSDGSDVAFEEDNGNILIRLEELETVEMFEIK
ncbi:MAG: alpha-amylase family protein [bacterium]